MVSTSIPFLNDLILKVMGEEKLSIVSGTTGYTGMFGRVAALVVTLLEFWSVFWLLKYFYKQDTSDDFTRFVFVMDVLSILFIPLTLKVGSGFNRVPTLLTMVNYCWFISKISNVRRQKKRLVIYSVILVFMITLFIANFRNAELREAVLIPFFEQNELVKEVFR